MLYFILDQDAPCDPQAPVNEPVVKVSDSRPLSGCYMSRHDFLSFAEAECVADKASALGDTRYIATDAGPGCSPRYDVVRLPQVGDDVSFAFNGDSYPCGKVTRISASLKVITAVDEHGVRRCFHRRRQTGAWVEGGTWSLVRGHHRSLNPHF